MTGVCPHCQQRVPMDADHPKRIGPHSFKGAPCLGISRNPSIGSTRDELGPLGIPLSPDLASLLSTLREAGTAEDVDDYEPQRLIQDAADAIEALHAQNNQAAEVILKHHAELAKERAKVNENAEVIKSTHADYLKEKIKVAAYSYAASKVLDTIVGTTAWADAIRMLDAAHAKTNRPTNTGA